MEIERINTYTDDRFPRDVLLEHGAFLVDGCRPCSFKIRDACSATVVFDDYANIAELIEEFRFYTEHITVFYDRTGTKIAEFPPVQLQTLSIDAIQPSQFYVDTDKVRLYPRLFPLGRISLFRLSMINVLTSMFLWMAIPVCVMRIRKAGTG